MDKENIGPEDAAVRQGGRWRASRPAHRDAWFPGRTVGETALVIGPLTWFAGLLLRYLASHSATLTPRQELVAGHTFAAGAQLAAYMRHPALVTVPRVPGSGLSV